LLIAANSPDDLAARLAAELNAPRSAGVALSDPQWQSLRAICDRP
jgi:hypothetical protein